MIAHLIAIFIGGGLGASSRFLLSLAVTRAFGEKLSLPLGTMICNISGSFLIGLAAAFALGSNLDSHPLFRSLLIIGFLGGFTTFSTFSLEALLLFQAGRTVAAVVAIFGTLILCLTGVALGAWMGTRLPG